MKLIIVIATSTGAWQLQLCILCILCMLLPACFEKYPLCRALAPSFRLTFCHPHAFYGQYGSRFREKHSWRFRRAESIGPIGDVLNMKSWDLDTTCIWDFDDRWCCDDVGIGVFETHQETCQLVRQRMTFGFLFYLHLHLGRLSFCTGVTVNFP